MGTPKPEFTQCHKELDGSKIIGIDKGIKSEYKEHLEENITDLVYYEESYM